MMKQCCKIFRNICVLCILFLLTACSTEPVFYSKSEVNEYAKNVFGKVTYVSDEGNDEDGYTYTYKNKDGIEFHIITTTYHPSIDGSETIFYEKDINDDYLKSMILYYQNDINKLLDSYSLDYSWSDTFLAVHLETLDDVNIVSKAFVEIDALLNLEYDYSKYSNYSKYDGINIYIKPQASYLETNPDYDWKNTGSVARLCYANNKTNRKDEEACYEQVEKSIVNLVKNKKDERYEITDEQWFKYPAEVITSDIVNPEGNYMKFGYNETIGEYTTSSLDPCQDFEDFPYNYTNKGYFKYLVEYFGGTYSCDNYKATWTIDDNTWEAELITEDDSVQYKDFIVYKNGKKLKISEYFDTNRTNSGRSFTVSDIEKLLNVNSFIDQKNMTISIKK